MNGEDPRHVPVLLEAVRTLVAPQPGEVVVDLTVGLGGHARMLAEAVGPDGVLIGLDVDEGNLVRAREHLAGVPCRVILARENFANLETVLSEAGTAQADVLLADLGVSSRQLDDPQRGFSFHGDGPLDMRLDDRLTKTAADLVNALREEELGDVLFFNSQERFSRRIAKRICLARRERRVTRTSELVRLVCSAMDVNPQSRKSKIHPATRTFQALRIAVNGELKALESLLETAPQCLKPGGRIGVISFHSLEDGLVKRDFRRRKNEGVYSVLTKQPVTAEEAEREANPRSRSAKFRVAQRV